MKKNIQIQVLPREVSNKKRLLKIVSQKINIEKKQIKHIEILRRSIDARNKIPKVNLKIEVYVNEDYIPKIENRLSLSYKYVYNSEEILIIGAGPAGLFAALKLIEKGKKPIIIERGKDVRSRRVDLANITKNHIVNEDSNYCFGEGGAGTFSDGKLYTRSKKRGDVNNILDILVEHGANKNIKIDAQPHIGTNKLPKIIKAIRKTILKFGGEILFNSRITDIIIKNSKVVGVRTIDGTKIDAKKIILATGHSARDIFELLHEKSIYIEAKSLKYLSLVNF